MKQRERVKRGETHGKGPQREANANKWIIIVRKRIRERERRQRREDTYSGYRMEGAPEEAAIKSSTGLSMQ